MRATTCSHEKLPLTYPLSLPVGRCQGRHKLMMPKEIQFMLAIKGVIIAVLQGFLKVAGKLAGETAEVIVYVPLEDVVSNSEGAGTQELIKEAEFLLLILVDVEEALFLAEMEVAIKQRGELTPKTKKKIRMPSARSEPFVTGELGNIIESVLRLTGFEAVYAKPRAKFFPSVDAIIITKKGTIIFLQYTIRSDHSLNMEGVLSAWQQIQEGRKLNGLKELKGGPVFCFVVPDYRREFRPNKPEYSLNNMEKERDLFGKMQFRILFADYGE